MTRDEILDAAAQIFRQKGFHAASMQDIAEALHVQKASLYHHVSSKQEILVAVLDRALDVISERILGVLNQPVPPEVKLRQAMCAYLTTLLENRDLAAVLLLEHRSLAPELRVNHIPRRDRFEHLWRELIHEGLTQQAFECEDVALTARALLGMMNWTITWFRSDGQLTAEQVADQLARLTLDGLLIRNG